MKTNDILEKIRNPFVDEQDPAVILLLDYAMYGILILTCTAILPIIIIGWAATKAGDRLRRTEQTESRSLKAEPANRHGFGLRLAVCLFSIEANLEKTLEYNTGMKTNH